MCTRNKTNAERWFALFRTNAGEMTLTSIALLGIKKTLRRRALVAQLDSVHVEYWNPPQPL